MYKSLNMIVASGEIDGILNDYAEKGWEIICADIAEAPKQFEGTKVRLVAFLKKK